MHGLTRRFELARGGAHPLQAMEGLRGLAVGLVFLVHYVSAALPWIATQPSLVATARALQGIGDGGVDLFFVLSGYLIYGSLMSRPQPFVPYMARRVRRIYPTFGVVFVVYVVLSFAFPATSKIPAPASAGLVFLIQNFLLLPGILPIDRMITVAWSLSYEMFFYVAIPALIAWLGLRERSAAWRVRLFSAAAVAIALACAAGGGPIKMIMFIAGMLLHEAGASRRLPAPGSAWALGCLVVGLLGTLLPGAGHAAYVLRTALLFAAYFVLCHACLHEPSRWLARAFRWAPLRWLGNMSYSYYLVHGLAVKAAFLALAAVWPATGQGAWLFWLALPPTFLFTLVPAAALFLVIERPLSLMPPAPARSASPSRETASA